VPLCPGGSQNRRFKKHSAVLDIYHDVSRDELAVAGGCGQLFLCRWRFMMVKVKRPKNDAPLVQKYLKKYGFLKGYSSDWHAVGGDLYKAISLIDDE
jgi:hypothetical protein